MRERKTHKPRIMERSIDANITPDAFRFFLRLHLQILNLPILVSIKKKREISAMFVLTNETVTLISNTI